MKIFINGRFLTQSITGVQRYAHELLKALDILLSEKVIEDEYIILAPTNISTPLFLKNIKINKVGFLHGHMWEQFELPFYSNHCLLMNLCNTAPIFKKNQIITIHDASIYYNNSLSIIFRQYYKILYKFYAYFSKYIITVSSFSSREIMKYTKITEKKIKVIYLGGEHIRNITSASDILKTNNLIAKPYVLAVSSLNPNKNFHNIIKATNLISGKIDVVIAGSRNPKIFKGEEIKPRKNIHYLGYISDSDLKTLYENATVFLYPSFYEGFGLPPLEAMTMGCPVIVSNCSSLPEVCSDAAIYCNPYNSKDIAQKILEISRNKILRNECIEKGKSRAKLFSWRNCALETVQLINTVKKNSGQTH